jgi:hypothetical protein
MRQPKDNGIERTAALIVAYWEANPEASDEVEGVIWWLPELAAVPLPWVEAALNLLVVLEIADRTVRTDGRVVYCRRHRHEPRETS